MQNTALSLSSSPFNVLIVSDFAQWRATPLSKEKARTDGLCLNSCVLDADIRSNIMSVET
jgi:hypothetical protein